MITGYQGFFNPDYSAIISASTTTSAAISTGGQELAGIFIPATFTGTTLTFMVCSTLAGTYVPLYNSSGVVTYTVAPSRYIAINTNDFIGVAFLQIVSGSTESAQRTLICSLKGF